MKRRGKKADPRRKASPKSPRRLAFERAARRMELDLIRERLARPPEERMDFLRVRLPGGGSAL